LAIDVIKDLVNAMHSGRSPSIGKQITHIAIYW